LLVGVAVVDHKRVMREAVAVPVVIAQTTPLVGLYLTQNNRVVVRQLNRLLVQYPARLTQSQLALVVLAYHQQAEEQTHQIQCLQR
jgi:hypothetical protein